jgi:small subunit ribosomal protein S9
VTSIQYYGTGRRKHATARVFLRPGSGEIRINDRGLDDYFKRESLKLVIRQPFLLTETANKFDVQVRIAGGGHSGQAGAIRHGLSRALVDYNRELRSRLKEAGFLTRDSRIKERKKYGQKGARARFQYSKR